MRYANNYLGYKDAYLAERGREQIELSS